ncbi:MAG: hypothetical protein QOC96_1287 [Acidobacteriota bacterium]|jgi:hypothetical protein|nr:hypothetical protein [Acidobacteriota bacterium]
MTDKFQPRLLMTLLAIVLFCGAMAKSYAGGRPPVRPPLKPEEVDALVERFKPSLSKFITDKDQINQIQEKWQARKESLQGKDVLDAIELLFDDVKSVVADVETQKKIRHEWDSNDDEDEPDGGMFRLVKLSTSTSFALILLCFAIKRGRTL